MSTLGASTLNPSGLTNPLSSGNASAAAAAGVSGYNSGALALDTNALNSLKRQDNAKTPAAAREVAKQLESLFMREMIKSMRSATMKGGLMEPDPGQDFAYDMFDQQMSVVMSGQPGGLSAALTAQIARAMGVDEKEALAGLGTPGIGGVETPKMGFGGVPTSAYRDTVSRFGGGSGAAAAAAAAPAVRVAADNGTQSANQRFARWAQAAGMHGMAANVQAMDAFAPSPKGREEFVRAHAAAAHRVAQESGIPAAYMLGQAGHETGWGRHEIRGAGGANSFNLFGIKATGGWTGKVAEITTTEYEGGVPRKQKAKFRAYDSYEESFRDYARLISQNPRYAQAMQNTASYKDYARALQNAGYATDPQYANKLHRAIEGVWAVQGKAEEAQIKSVPSTVSLAPTAGSVAQARMNPMALGLAPRY